jgi:hypothetical protein
MNPMELTRFGELLDAYGGDPRRWPATERDAALALLAASPIARTQQQAAAWVDAGLDAYTVTAPSAALRARVIASAGQSRRGWRAIVTQLWRDLGGWQLAGPAFAASLALGALLPVWLGDVATDLPDEDLIAAMQLVDEQPEWTP